MKNQNRCAGARRESAEAWRDQTDVQSESAEAWRDTTDAKSKSASAWHKKAGAWLIRSLRPESARARIRRPNAVSDRFPRAKRFLRDDDLTGILGYRAFVAEVCARLSAPETILENKIYLFINIENFKTYNDQYGFEAGNRFLISMAKKLTALFSGDPLARQEDDHFVVFTNFARITERITALKEWMFAAQEDSFLGLKIGAKRPASRDEDPRQSLDGARYAAETLKSRCGQDFLEFDAEMDVGYHKRQYIIHHFDSAVRNGQIQVYYQPIVRCDGEELCACEALARWNDPLYGAISPAEFVPILEECRRIDRLDAAVLEIVCRDLRDAIDRGLPFVPVSLNFSRLDFELTDAVQMLEDLTQVYRIPHDFLRVEMTESALAEHADVLREAIDRLHRGGFAVWLDDFGSGYSSLNVLKDYPFDLMKIDLRFLIDFSQESKSSAILQSVVSLASALGMKALAEGVQTQEQADYLRRIGCDCLQGYLYGEPLPRETLREKIGQKVYLLSKAPL